jgi:hypothetical protein
MRTSKYLRGALSSGALVLVVCGLGILRPATAFDGTATPLLAPADALHAPTAAPETADRSKTLTALEYAADQGHLAA